MKNFMDKNFLLQTETAQELYHNHAAKMPIIDYHCHLNPQMVADDYRFKSLTEIWLGGDHYKWRAMRSNGVDECFVPVKKRQIGRNLRNGQKRSHILSVIHCTNWTHLELKTAFGIDKVLNPKTAREIYDECNEKLSSQEYSARGMMRRYHVETVCTTMILSIHWNIILELAKVDLKSRCFPHGVRIKLWLWKFLQIFALI